MMSKLNSPVYVVLRIVLYASLLFGIAEAIFFDAAHPMEDGYFGEITFTEIGQEIILIVLFVFYIILGSRWRSIQPVANFVALFYLAAFIREFNFLIDWWIYPVLLILAFFVWLFYRDFKKIYASTQQFFSVPASAWFMVGFLITMVFSRLFGRSEFWRLLYHDDTYRLAKAATEEGLELLGNTIMLIGAIEFMLYFWYNEQIRKEKQKS